MPNEKDPLGILGGDETTAPADTTHDSDPLGILGEKKNPSKKEAPKSEAPTVKNIVDILHPESRPAGGGSPQQNIIDAFTGKKPIPPTQNTTPAIPVLKPEDIKQAVIASSNVSHGENDPELNPTLPAARQAESAAVARQKVLDEKNKIINNPELFKKKVELEEDISNSADAIHKISRDPSMKALDDLQLQLNNATQAKDESAIAGISEKIKALKNTRVADIGVENGHDDEVLAGNLKKLGLKPDATVGEMHDKFIESTNNLHKATGDHSDLMAAHDNAVKEYDAIKGNVRDPNDNTVGTVHVGVDQPWYKSLGPFMKGMMNSWDDIGTAADRAQYMAGAIDKDELAKRTDQRYIKNYLDATRTEGTLGQITESVGGLAPLVASTAVAPESALGRVLTSAVAMGTQAAGGGFYEGYVKARQDGKTRDEAIDEASKQSNISGGVNAVIGGVMPFNDAIVNKFVLPKASFATLKKWALETGLAGAQGGSGQVLENMLAGKDPTTDAGRAAMSTMLLSIVGHATHARMELPKTIRDIYDVSTGKMAAEIRASAEDAMNKGLLSFGDGNNLISKADEMHNVLSKLPHDWSPSDIVTAKPFQEKIDQYHADMKNATSDVVRESIKAKMEEAGQQMLQAVGENRAFEENAKVAKGKSLIADDELLSAYVDSNKELSKERDAIGAMNDDELRQQRLDAFREKAAEEMPQKFEEDFLADKKAKEEAAKPKPEPEKDPIDDKSYDTFINKGYVPIESLEKIAKKVMDKTDLSDREKAIFASKTTDINEIIKTEANDRKNEQGVQSGVAKGEEPVKAGSDEGGSPEQAGHGGVVQEPSGQETDEGNHYQEHFPEIDKIAKEKGVELSPEDRDDIAALVESDKDSEHPVSVSEMIDFIHKKSGEADSYFEALPENEQAKLLEDESTSHSSVDETAKNPEDTNDGETSKGVSDQGGQEHTRQDAALEDATLREGASGSKQEGTAHSEAGRDQGKLDGKDLKGLDKAGDALHKIMSKFGGIKQLDGENDVDYVHEFKRLGEGLIEAGKAKAETLHEDIKNFLGDKWDDKFAPYIKQASEALSPPQSKTIGGSHEAMSERARTLGIDAPERGKVLEPEEYVARGRQLLKEGVDPNQVAADFKKDGLINSDRISIARAQYEKLGQESSRAEELFGSDSQHYKEAVARENEWRDNVVKPMGTAAGGSFTSLQGRTDLETGTFGGMRRAFEEKNNRPMNPEEEKAAKLLAEKNKKLIAENESLLKQLSEAHEKAANDPNTIRRQKARERIERKKSVAKQELGSALDNIATLLGAKQNLAGGERASLVIELSKAGKALIDLGEAKIEDVIEKLRPHVEGLFKDGEKFEDYASDVEKAIRTRVEDKSDALAEKQKEQDRQQAVLDKESAKAEKEKNKQAQKDAQDKQRLLDEQQAAIDKESIAIEKEKNAAKMKAEKERIQKGQKELDERRAELAKEQREIDKQSAKVMRDIEKARQKAVDDQLNEVKRQQAVLDKASRDIALKENAEQQKFEDLQTRFANKDPKDLNFDPDEAKAIWDYAKKEYLDEPGANIDTVVHGVSADLGLTPDQVRSAIAQPKGARVISDELYRKLGERRQIIQAAKDWVNNSNRSPVSKFFDVVSKIPSAFFQAKVFGHGTVAPITHAGMDLFQPSGWKNYFKFMGQTYQFAFGTPTSNLLFNSAKFKANYEKAMADFMHDPMYIQAKRAGLAIDPEKEYDEYQNNESPWLKSMGLGKIYKIYREGTEIGNRGFNALKPYRLEKFKKLYNDLPNSAKADPETVKKIASIVNHSTGASDIPVPKLASSLMFAPKLEMSRWQRLVVEPATATKTLLNWNNALPSEQAAAKIVAKRSGEMVATYFGALLVNSVIQNLAGSPNKVNLTDPAQSDWLKFKAGDKTLDVSGGMVSTFHFIGNLLHTTFADKKELHEAERSDKAFGQIGQYFRGKLSPFAGTAFDWYSHKDFEKNVLPPFADKPGKGKHRMTWSQYMLSQQTPIPVAEAVHTIEKSMESKGISSPDVTDILSGILSFTVAGFTGARLSESQKPKKQQTNYIPPPPGK